MTFEPDGAAHRVEDVRGAWTEAAMRTTPEARRKVLRIVAADRMNVAAQNAFLKLLEEPPAVRRVDPRGGGPGTSARDDPVALPSCRPPALGLRRRPRMARRAAGWRCRWRPDDVARIESAVCAARSSGDWLRGCGVTSPVSDRVRRARCWTR
jgi:hypothetical protein